MSLSVLAAFKGREAVVAYGPMAPGRACLLASWWLLREIEASHSKMSRIRLDWSKRRAD